MLRSRFDRYSRNVFIFSVLVTLVLLIAVLFPLRNEAFFSFLNRDSFQISLFFILGLSIIFLVLIFRSGISLRSKMVLVFAGLVFTLPRVALSMLDTSADVIDVSPYVFIPLSFAYFFSLALLLHVVRKEFS